MPIQHSTWAERVPLIDYRGVDWSNVTRTRYFCYQRFHYCYPGPITNLHQRLIVVPPDRYGDQVVVDHDLTSAPHPAVSKEHTDIFGNRIWTIAVDRVEHELAFETIMTVERTAPERSVAISPTTAARFRDPTSLTAADERITTIARELLQSSRNPEDLAERISAWVADSMSYGSGATGVQTTAAQALAIGKGLCQDYAHIMLAICRVAGLAARYVSGHMLAEGGTHAWVEALLPGKNGGLRAVAFDPTNRRRANLSYTIVAVGRDYRDVAPTSGSFTAPYSGRLVFTKRAGLTLIELGDGEILESGAPSALGSGST
ncbi:MAG TPA: transglutaminase family protein [Herpetosiphonaceae bacterium]